MSQPCRKSQVASRKPSNDGACRECRECRKQSPGDHRPAGNFLNLRKYPPHAHLTGRHYLFCVVPRPCNPCSCVFTDHPKDPPTVGRGRFLHFQLERMHKGQKVGYSHHCSPAIGTSRAQCKPGAGTICTPCKSGSRPGLMPDNRTTKPTQGRACTCPAVRLLTLD